MARDSAPLCSGGEDCAILFARTPIPGQVKSRLRTHLSAERACAFHCASTSDTAALLAAALPEVPTWIFISEVPEPGVGCPFALPPGFRCAVQQGRDLGERMAAAFLRAFGCGARRVVLFGSDSPTLPPEVVPQAFEALADCDLTLGPTEDGGYYLIGCRRFDPQLFHGVEWSTSRTLDQTAANSRRLGYRTTLLERWFDLDEWGDVERLLADTRQGIPLPSHLASFFRELEVEGSRGNAVLPG